MMRILGAVLLIATLTTVDAFNVGSFAAPRAFLPLAGKAGGLHKSMSLKPRRECSPKALRMSSTPEQDEREEKIRLNPKLRPEERRILIELVTSDRKLKRRPERARNEGTTRPKRLDDTRCTPCRC